MDQPKEKLTQEKFYVKRVIDGDTLIIETGERVRLIGVDTPEIKSPYRTTNDYFGQEAKTYLKDRVEGRMIYLEGDSAQTSYDKYGRRLGYIIDENNILVNRDLVILGYAEAIRYFPYRYKKEFLELEKKAKKNKIGIWGK